MGFQPVLFTGWKPVPQVLLECLNLLTAHPKTVGQVL